MFLKRFNFFIFISLESNVLWRCLWYLGSRRWRCSYYN